MTPRSKFSEQTLCVLAVLTDQPSHWRHGYEMAQQTGLKSGTLYPILIRLADRGLLEACWEDEPAQGRPRRHLFRLTPDGLAASQAALAVPAKARRAPRTAVQGPAARGSAGAIAHPAGGARGAIVRGRA